MRWGIHESGNMKTQTFMAMATFMKLWILGLLGVQTKISFFCNFSSNTVDKSSPFLKPLEFFYKIRVEGVYMKGSTLERRPFVCYICDKELSTS